MQTVYIAGGAGFIGSHLCKRLLADGYEVVCIDNFLTSSKKNINPFFSNAHFHFLQKDILLLTEHDFEHIPLPQYIFHLASPASPNLKSPRSYMSYPIETLRVNSQGTYILLNLAKKMSSRFLYASTSEVYGDPKVSPQVETYWGNVNPNGIRSVYDEGKRFGEAITIAYVRKFSLDARIARIFNTYGPHMQNDDGRVVSNFILQSLHNEPLTIYGKGKQTRSFCFVSDLVEGLMKLMFTKNINGEVVNLGNPNERSIKVFAQLIKKLTKSSSQIVFEELPADDPNRRCPDISKAKKLLGWEPKVPLEEGLQKTIEYFKTV
ncbi:MAG TPA: UDP-glucuronic acid decarboxylase family protein [Patescibacteria group bacterium]|nr:UDP-glucuronic acid decarboxylase family protein [Patescibacteria group bacterium]